MPSRTFHNPRRCKQPQDGAAHTRSANMKLGFPQHLRLFWFCGDDGGFAEVPLPAAAITWAQLCVTSCASQAGTLSQVHGPASFFLSCLSCVDQWQPREVLPSGLLRSPTLLRRCCCRTLLNCWANSMELITTQNTVALVVAAAGEGERALLLTAGDGGMSWQNAKPLAIEQVLAGDFAKNI